MPRPVFDFSLIFAVRLHDDNPWVEERLAMLSQYYDDLPPVVVVDFGSTMPHAKTIESRCEEQGFKYVFLPDHNTFSLSIARNSGFINTDTQLCLFIDIDFFFTPDGFGQLQRMVETFELRDRIDCILNFPAYHLSEKTTGKLVAANDRKRFLERLAFDAIYAEFGEPLEFAAPYSNVFLIHRKFFDLSGGYDERFRGHGSEDFEFLTRAALVAGFHKIPARLEQNTYGPTRAEFFAPKPYAGHRRLLEAISLPTELSGMKVYHLWHPTPRTDGWLKENDWKRERLNEAFAGYLSNYGRLPDIDYLPRPRRALCICRHKDHRGYFIPLRLQGYSLETVRDENPEIISDLKDKILCGEYDLLAVFNPYMKSHAPFLPLFEAARSSGVETAVVERGALPRTIYYAQDVSYCCDSFSEAAFQNETYSREELDEAATYIAELRRGASTLEANASYEATAQRRSSAGRRIVFVPLQLSDDMAVTMFLREAQDYTSFEAGLDAAASRHPDVDFIVKAHPLSKASPAFMASNISLADGDDNIHRLIDEADCVVCYNSGVGLLALLHEKPCVCVGNAFYLYGNLGKRAPNVEAAVRTALEDTPAPARADVIRLCAWFIHRKYSFFVADDRIIETDTRRIHSYANIAVTRLRWKGRDLRLRRFREDVPFSVMSYGGGRIGMQHLPRNREAASPSPSFADLDAAAIAEVFSRDLTSVILPHDTGTEAEATPKRFHFEDEPRPLEIARGLTVNYKPQAGGRLRGQVLYTPGLDRRFGRLSLFSEDSAAWLLVQAELDRGILEHQHRIDAILLCRSQRPGRIFTALHVSNPANRNSFHGRSSFPVDVLERPIRSPFTLSGEFWKSVTDRSTISFVIGAKEVLDGFTVTDLIVLKR
ncbi:MAG: galactosyltransferase-related protein [Spirochaetia bacterium]